MSTVVAKLKNNKGPTPKWLQILSHWFRPYDLVKTGDENPESIPRFRFLANAIELWGLQVLLIAAIALIMPGLWHSQTASGPFILLLTFIGIGFFVAAPFEWFYHRFGLHRLLLFRLIPRLNIMPGENTTGMRRRLRHIYNNFVIGCVYYIGVMAFDHGAHHKLTDVTPMNPTRLSELFNAINRYEIKDNEQTEHAVFPHFSIFIFWVVFLPVAMLLQYAANVLGSMPGINMPHLPVILATMLSVTWQLWLYESSHAIMHKPYQNWWKPRIENPIYGKWFSNVYRFHFFHHMNESCSLGVVGAVWFCYFWDRVFGTYKLARLEIIESASHITQEVLELRKEDIMMLPNVTQADFAPPKPMSRWIAYLDSEAAKAQIVWNQLFVASLQEVRRRTKAEETRAVAVKAEAVTILPRPSDLLLKQRHIKGI